MTKKLGFDAAIEKLSRRTANKTGRRGFVGKLGGLRHCFPCCQLIAVVV